MTGNLVSRKEFEAAVLREFAFLRGHGFAGPSFSTDEGAFVARFTGDGVRLGVRLYPDEGGVITQIERGERILDLETLAALEGDDGYFVSAGLPWASPVEFEGHMAAEAQVLARHLECALGDTGAAHFEEVGGHV
jgi:hypothetical protein